MFRAATACALGVVMSSALLAQAPKLAFPRPSPPSTVKQQVGLTDIEFTYSRPGVKGRQVFGGLEPYGKVWRTGANEATKITFSTGLKFGGADVPAGSYALFSIPDAKEWTVILNKVTGQWGAYQYDEKNDVVRVKVAPVKLAELVETFTIDINDIRDDSATLNLRWQNTCVPVKLQFDTVANVQKQINDAIASGRKLTVGEYDGAAMFYLEHDLELDKAATWLDAAIAERPKAFALYNHKARLLAKQGKTAEAKAAAQQSIELAKGQTGPAPQEYVHLNEMLLQSLGR